jgi:hypothetical protein
MNDNLPKSKVVVFRNGGVITKTEKCCYKGKFLNIVLNYKYLGVVFNCLLKWNMAHDALAKEEAEAVIIFQSLCNGIPCSTYFNLFDNVVLPILCYGVEIWVYERTECVERV